MPYANDYESEYKPRCADCLYRKKRGHFYLCKAGGMGYKHVGEEVKCGAYERITDEN